MLGAYGAWAAAQLGERPGELSFRAGSWPDVAAWKAKARGALLGLLHVPPAAAADVQIHGSGVHEGVEVEELSWQLPWGPRTKAFFLKPRGACGKLPGVLAFHDHGGDKHFGRRKIVRTGPADHALAVAHQEEYYGGVGWANELARRGFGVLVPDVFPFDSRRILVSDVPPLVVHRLTSPPLEVRELTPEDLAAHGSSASMDVAADEPPAQIAAYNAFAAQHEAVVAKSLFCAGLTWPGVMVAEDRAALDYLVSRPDVDSGRIGCGGLSGGGLRTVFLGGLDDRIRCAVCAGMMTTWRDYLLRTSYTHTWMIYVPGLPPLLDFPEILGLRVPLPSLVLATTEDPLFTLTETERAAGMLTEIYGKAGAGDRFLFKLHRGPHKLDLPMQSEAFEWFEKWLS